MAPVKRITRAWMTTTISRLTPGMHLPILAPSELVRRAPDITLLLVWNFAAEIYEQQREYRGGGGRFLVPVPKPVLVS